MIFRFFFNCDIIAKFRQQICLTVKNMLKLIICTPGAKKKIKICWTILLFYVNKELKRVFVFYKNIGGV